MQITKLLKREHERLRAKLGVLESSLERKDVSEERLEVILDQLNREFEEHIGREEYFLPFLYSVTQGEIRGYHEAREHADIRTSIRLLGDILREKHSVSLGAIEAYESHLVDMLKEHMDREEAFVFPIAEKVLGEECLEAISHLIASDT